MIAYFFVSITALLPAVGAAKDEDVRLRFLAFEKAGNFGRFELVNRTGKAFELFRDQGILVPGEPIPPFEPGFDDGEYWANGKWHNLGVTGVGYRASYRVKAGERLRFSMNLEQRFGNFKSGTLVRVRLAKVGGGTVTSEPFRWRELASEIPTGSADLPREAGEILRLIPSIPKETNLEGAFRALGLTLPDKPKETLSKPGSTIVHARYDAFQPSGWFVLECEYTMRPEDIVPGELHSLQLRECKRKKSSGLVYVTLKPTWESRK